MAMPGKEGAPLGVDQLAVQEVEGYIDRIEKQAEITGQNNQVKQVAVTQNTITTTNENLAIPKLAVNEKQKVILPLEKEEIEKGTKNNVSQGVRWLSEWCVYMIKKYPGRIFYAPIK